MGSVGWIGVKSNPGLLVFEAGMVRYLDCVRGLQAVMRAGAENRVDVREMGRWAKTVGIVSRIPGFESSVGYLAALRSG